MKIRSARLHAALRTSAIAGAVVGSIALSSLTMLPPSITNGATSTSATADSMMVERVATLSRSDTRTPLPSATSTASAAIEVPTTAILVDSIGDALDAHAAAEKAAAEIRAAEEAARVEAERVAAEAEAARVAAEQAEADRQAEIAAAEAAEAAEKAAEQEAADAAASEQKASTKTSAPAKTESAPSTTSAPVATTGSAAKGSFKSYAMSLVSADQFSCLEKLWGKESGWNPNAQNPTSTAYGIAQFLNSTWKMTGIAKTSDGYRQIDAGIIYLDKVYGSPCGGWSHSVSTGWY